MRGLCRLYDAYSAVWSEEAMALIWGVQGVNFYCSSCKLQQAQPESKQGPPKASFQRSTPGQGIRLVGHLQRIASQTLASGGGKEKSYGIGV